MRILGILHREKSIARIVAPISRIVKELDHYASEMGDAAQKDRIEAEALQDSSMKKSNLAQEAERLSQKYQQLIF